MPSALILSRLAATTSACAGSSSTTSMSKRSSTTGISSFVFAKVFS